MPHKTKQNRATRDLRANTLTRVQHRADAEEFLVQFVKALARESAREYDQKEQIKNIFPAEKS